MDPIYTTETMATRALAAEIRHDSHAFTVWAVAQMNLDENSLGTVSNVRCEGDENIDIVISYGNVSIGIEAKFDHEVTNGQLLREAGAVDHLILLVLDIDDATGHEDEVSAVATWTELLAQFGSSRLSAEDIDRIPATKKKIERRMRALKLQERLPADWTAEVIRGDGGMSSVVVTGPAEQGQRKLCGQIQVYGRDSRRALEDITLEYHVGVEVHLNDEDFPEDATARPPWIEDLDILEDVLTSDPARFQVRRSRPGNGSAKTKWGPRKMPIVREHLRGREWLAQGYTDWSLGAKSSIRSIDDLDTLAQEAVDLFVTWQGAR